MTLILVLHMFTAEGKQQTYNMALFTNSEDCNMAGALVSEYLSKANSRRTIVLYTCDPIA